MRKLKIGHIYRHFKENYYYIKKIVYDSETAEPCVVYQALYDEHKAWVRKLSEFLSEIDKNRPDNVTKQKYRFKLINLNKEELK